MWKEPLSHAGRERASTTGGNSCPLHGVASGRGRVVQRGSGTQEGRGPAGSAIGRSVGGVGVCVRVGWRSRTEPVATETEGSPQLPARCFGYLSFIFPGCSFALLARARPLLPPCLCRVRPATAHPGLDAGSTPVTSRVRSRYICSHIHSHLGRGIHTSFRNLGGYKFSNSICDP